MADRMECLRLALGSRMDAKPLTEADATDAIKVAELLYAYACKDMPPGDGKPMAIQGVAYPAGYDVGAPG